MDLCSSRIVQGSTVCYKIIVIKTVWYGHKIRHIVIEQDRELRINQHIYSQLMYNTGAKSIQWGLESLFSKWFLENWTAKCKRIKLDHTQKSTNSGLKNQMQDLKLSN